MWRKGPMGRLEIVGIERGSAVLEAQTSGTEWSMADFSRPLDILQHTQRTVYKTQSKHTVKQQIHDHI